MLSVGREINIEKRDTVCRECKWEGAGNQLSTGLIRINSTEIYVYAYRCPSCNSFNVAYKGKLLLFNLAGPVDQNQESKEKRQRDQRE